jgi:hypothetical protein
MTPIHSTKPYPSALLSVALIGMIDENFRLCGHPDSPIVSSKKVKDFCVVISSNREEILRMCYIPGASCEICGEKDTHLVSCRMCGAYVCTECIDHDEVCLNCNEARCYICHEYLASRACNICGKLVCEDHGSKVSESTTCDNCRKREV